MTKEEKIKKATRLALRILRFQNLVSYKNEVYGFDILESLLMDMPHHVMLCEEYKRLKAIQPDE